LQVGFLGAAHEVDTIGITVKTEQTQIVRICGVMLDNEPRTVDWRNLPNLG
jgi:hypothetical protein